MEENNIEIKEEIVVVKNNGQQQIVGAIILAGVLIAGAILLKGNVGTPVPQNGANNPVAINTKITPVSAQDRVIGNPQAKVTLVMYEDFQCPFCGKFFTESEQTIRDTYVKNGNVQLVYRDFAFLGTFVTPYVAAKDESTNAAESAECAGDQGKFWEYHDYLFTHQNGENKGGFSVTNLKSFAKTLGLDTATFNQCLDSDKYAQAVANSKTEASKDGVTGTPKGFILVKGKTFATIDGAEPYTQVQQKIDAALK
jgi:protein-disulfide isomerase